MDWNSDGAFLLLVVIEFQPGTGYGVVWFLIRTCWRRVELDALFALNLIAAIHPTGQHGGDR